MKPISLKTLENLEQSYQKDVHQKAIRRALAKTPIDQIAYVTEAELHTQFRFSIDIDTLPVTNQKASGRCWLFAGLNVVRELVAKKYGLKDFELSQNYQAFWDKFEKINYFLESMDNFLTCDSDDRTLKHLLQMGIQDGGQWDMFVSLVDKYGVVPKDQMPETYASSNTGAMNRLINIKLRKYAAEARALAKQHQLKEKDELKARVLKELYGFLCTNFGLPPKNVRFEYVTKDNQYQSTTFDSPKAFFDHIGINLHDYASIIHSPTEDKPYLRSYTIAYLGNVIDGKPIIHLNLPMERLKALVINQLSDKEIVWFGADVSRDGDREKGIWDNQAYDYETAFQMSFSMTKAQKLDYLQGAMNHAMVITGVNLIDGQANKWKIENSWGSEKGQKGYYLMSGTWFDENTYQAVIHKKYLTDIELKAYESEPIVLKPWDPMGSLAK
ncbi:C1 family peptidase [Acholeplasma vituli]|uniref:Aminopeptidase n=1 Tax=Paracholeplasma vituli TaxID=69473 RepID=A0ABT2PVC9_9MOLU|nr:C1 family peptidase [Paracholeplasma vituli]MCU0104673.1 C1 family peptidase [Paracholeplasma vituli]